MVVFLSQRDHMPAGAPRGGEFDFFETHECPLEATLRSGASHQGAMDELSRDGFRRRP
jgi:hypothetical protein